jgi:hypothetical protein
MKEINQDLLQQKQLDKILRNKREKKTLDKFVSVYIYQNSIISNAYIFQVFCEVMRMEIYQPQ